MTSHNDYNHYNDYIDYNDYRNSDLDLVTFSDTVDYYWQIAKLEAWHWGLGKYSEKMEI